MKQRLYITCPSYALRNPRERAQIIRTARVWADAMEWEVIESPLLERYFQPGCWLPMEARAEDMVRAMQHDIIWACRGGYAAVHLIPSLLNAHVDHPPLLVGYSDITVLHACWSVRGWAPSLYGTFGDYLQESRQGNSLMAYFKGQPFVSSHMSEPAVRVLRPGSVAAPLFAACLVVLANLVGTPAFPSLRGHILAIEDIDEKPYAIDFALNQLYLAGQLEGVAGLLGGSFHHQPPADYGGPSVDEIIGAWGTRLGVPTITRLPFGHLEDHIVVPNGIVAELDAHADGRWSLRWSRHHT